MKTGLRLISNSLYRTVYFGLSVVIALAMTPVLVRELGDRMYGLWAIVGAFVGYYGFLDFGITTAVSRYVSRAAANRDAEEINRILSASCGLFLGVSTMIALATAYAYFASPRFFADAAELDAFRRAVLILSLHLALGFPLRVFSGALTAHLRYDLITCAGIVRLVVANGLIYHYVTHGGGIVIMACSLFAAHAVEYIMFVVFAYRVCPGIQLRWRLISAKQMESLLNYSGKSLLINIANILRFRIDLFIVAGFLGLSKAAVYAIGARLIEYLVDLIGSLVGNLTPLFSRHNETGGKEKLRATMLSLIPFNAIIALFAGSCLLFFGKTFMIWWMGRKFADSYEVMAILCVPMTVSLMQIAGTNMLLGISEHRSLAIFNVIGGVTNLILSLILVQYLGIHGVALGTAIEVSLLKALVEPALICKALGMDKSEYFKAYLGIAIRTLASLLILFLIAAAFLQPTFVSLICWASLITGLFLPMALYFCLGKSERGMLASAFSGWRRVS